MGTLKGFLGLLVVAAVAGFENIDSKHSQLPKLFYLDDYEKCLSDKDGIFCAAQFQVFSEDQDNPTFKLLQEYGEDPDMFNRTFLHRGYCVSRRCPGGDGNLSARFERCVDSWAQRRHGLRARLHTLHYCQTHGERPSNTYDTEDTPHRVFLCVFYFLMFLNFVGTIYDLTTDEKERAIPILAKWSVCVNWRRLTSHNSQRVFGPMDGWKVLLLCGAIFCHATIISSKLYQKNPGDIEEFIAGKTGGAMVGALTTITQTFVVMSNYLVTYNLLKLSRKHTIPLYMMPLIMLKRLLRMAPLYLLLNGFAATWWASMREGPQWPVLVGNESNICRSKFWASAGFLQNFIDPERICLVQTWILAVDIQLHVLTVLCTMLLIRCRRWAVHILVALFAGAVGITAFVAFKHSYIPLFKFMVPDAFRLMFREQKSFAYFFTTPVNCMMSAVTGMTVAYINNEIEERKIQKKSTGLHRVCPMFFIFAYFCYYLKYNIVDPWWITAMIPIERMIFCIWASLMFYSMDDEGWLMDFLRWRVLRSLGRVSMAVSMVHWCVNMALVASRSTLQEFSLGVLALETIGTWVISYIIAVPLTVLIEYPMQASFDGILNKFIK